MIIAIGEALIDRKNGVDYVGGCPLNVAVAASRLGSAVTFLCPISSDENGNRILSYAIENNLIFEPSMCNDSHPTMVASVTSENQANKYEFFFRGTSAFAFDREKLRHSISLNSGISCVFTGSVSFANPVARKEIVESLPDCPVFFDPNVRPFVIDDRNEYLKAVKEFALKSEFVKVSEEDLEWLGLTAEGFLPFCKKNLIVTCGAKGSFWYEEDTRPVFCPAVEVEDLKDTIGCGDCFSGAVLTWLEERKRYFNLKANEKLEAMEFASRCCAVNCRREGCNPAFRSEVDA